MPTDTLNPFVEAATLGALAGMRSQAAPAAVRTLELGRSDGPLSLWLGLSPVFAAVEMVADKLPFLPARTQFLGLGGRVVSAVLAVASLKETRRRKEAALAVRLVIAGAAALASTHLWYRLRRAATERLHIPNVLAGLAEDAVVMGMARQLAR